MESKAWEKEVAICWLFFTLHLGEQHDPTCVLKTAWGQMLEEEIVLGQNLGRK